MVIVSLSCLSALGSLRPGLPIIYCHTCTVVFKVHSKCCLYLYSHAPLTMHTHPGRQRVITQLDNIVQFDC